MVNEQFQINKKITPIGLASSLLFSCGPFLYGNIGGHGIFLYISAIYIAFLFFQALNNNGLWRIDFTKNKILKAFLIMIIWQCISFVWSPAFNSVNIYSFVKRILLIFLVFLNFYSERDKKAVSLVSTIVATGLVVYMLVFGTMTWQGRYTFTLFGVEQDPNYMCYFLFLPIMFMISVLLKKKTFIIKILSVICCITLIVGLLASGSRGGLIGILLGICTYLIAYKKTSITKIFKIITIGLFAIVLVSYLFTFLPTDIVTRFSISDLLSNGGSGRMEVWAYYWNRIIEDPISLIFGHGSYSSLVNSTAAHNYFLETLYENGIIGVLFAIIFFVKCIRKFIEENEWLSLSILIAALTTSLTLSVGTMLQFWLCISATVVIAKK